MFVPIVVRGRCAMGTLSRKSLDENGSGVNPYTQLPPAIDLSETFASVDVSVAEVEQSGNLDWNQGADPYLRVAGWKRS